jgi:hypothetical protein
MQPARYIHWKASARHKRLQEKVFEPSAQTKILLLVDVASFAEHQAQDAFERCLEIVASLAVQCERNGTAMGFWTNGSVWGGSDRLSVSRGNQKATAVLEILARLRMEAAGPISKSLRSSGGIDRGGSAVCFSYQDNPEIRTLRDYFGRHRIPMDAVVCHRHGDLYFENGTTFILDELTIGEGPQ